MSSGEHEDLAAEVRQLHQEVAQLHLEMGQLIQVIDDLGGSVRYLTNNLLDDRHQPELAAWVRDRARGSAPGPAAQTPSEEHPRGGQANGVLDQ